MDPLYEPYALNLEALSVLDLSESESFTDMFDSHIDLSNKHKIFTKVPKLSLSSQETGCSLSRNERHKNNKKDDFDYNAYIKEELSRFNAENIDPKARKQLIQKIRNRISAQRSRQRSKITMKNLQTENNFLKSQNYELIKTIKHLRDENETLKKQTKSFNDSFRSFSTINVDDNSDFDSPKISRDCKNTINIPYRNLLFVSMIIMTIMICPKISTDRVKIGGIVPLFTNNIKGPFKKIPNIKNICETFCPNSKYFSEDTKFKKIKIDKNKNHQDLLQFGNSNKSNFVYLKANDKNNIRDKYEVLAKNDFLETNEKEGFFILYA